jgi:hypothetical protein
MHEADQSLAGQRSCAKMPPIALRCYINMAVRRQRDSTGSAMQTLHLEMRNLPNRSLRMPLQDGSSGSIPPSPAPRIAARLFFSFS